MAVRRHDHGPSVSGGGAGERDPRKAKELVDHLVDAESGSFLTRGEGGTGGCGLLGWQLAKEHDMSYGKITITVEASVDLEQWKAFTGAVSDEAALEQAPQSSTGGSNRWRMSPTSGSRRLLTWGELPAREVLGTAGALA